MSNSEPSTVTPPGAGAATGASEPEIRYKQRTGGGTLVNLMVGQRSVSGLAIIPYTLCIGVARVRMDGIGDVGTEADCRRRGYARRVLEASVHWMQEHDAALSMLYGIRDFYPKFGFATAGPDHFIHLTDLSRDADLPAGWRARPVAATDLPAVQRLYAQSTATAVGAAVRGPDEPVWSRLAALAAPAAPAAQRTQRTGLDMASGGESDRDSRNDAGGSGDAGRKAAMDECRVVENQAGQIVAYAWLGKGCWYVDRTERHEADALVIGEVMAVSTLAADALLAACRGWANDEAERRDRPVRRVVLALPPEGPVAAAAMNQDAWVNRTYSRQADSMVRVINAGRLLAALRPELVRRLRVANIDFAGTLHVQTDIGSATVSLATDGATQSGAAIPADGETASCAASHAFHAFHAPPMAAPSAGDRAGAQITVALPQTALARLALGAFPPGDLLARLEQPPSDKARELLEALFPWRNPHMYLPDRY